MDPSAARGPDVWERILARDAALDGRLFFAVRTTGIVCKPSCPARRPRRENVRFFDSLAAATEAGYRACRRCRPDEAPPRSLAESAARRLGSPGGPAWRSVARELGVSSATLRRAFQRTLGVTPSQFAAAARRTHVQRALRKGRPVRASAYRAGHGSTSRLYSGARHGLGMTPAAYARGGAGESIWLATSPCLLGFVAVGVTKRGVCAVRLGDTAQAVVSEIRREFPLAAFEQPAPLLAKAMGEVLRRIDGHSPRFDVPLDLRATAFQRRVWDALAAIPHGQTRSYAAIAADLGAPSAARAVARACASNPAAVLVPCHRVVASDGSLSGYRWGLGRKRSLLERESTVSVDE